MVARYQHVIEFGVMQPTGLAACCRPSGRGPTMPIETTIETMPGQLR
jgi:hypothetical protein